MFLGRGPRALVLAFMCSALLAPSAQAAVPTPDKDPFYAVPAGIDRLKDGVILDSRPVQATSVGIPLPARAWQVKFKTTDNLRHATATVSTVMVPNAAWAGAGPRPVVSYQTAEDGVDTKCSPSYALRAGAAALPANSAAETGLMRLALMRGWIVTAPDYEGPDSQFLGEQMSAHGVLDGLRATRAFKPAGVARRAPLALWGYSGGSLASAWAAQRQPTLAPELRLSGVALGGVVGDIKATLLAFNGGPAGGAVAMGLSGVDRAYPQANVLQYLNDAGRATVVGASHDCIADAGARYPFWSMAQYGARPGVIDEAGPSGLLASISPATMSAVPTGPVYMYTTLDDEFAPLDAALKLKARWCGAGVRVQQVTDPPSDHITETVVGAPAAMNYLADRFAGKPAPTTC